jgi:hypothetical protein
VPCLDGCPLGNGISLLNLVLWMSCTKWAYSKINDNIKNNAFKGIVIT